MKRPAETSTAVVGTPAAALVAFGLDQEVAGGIILALSYVPAIVTWAVTNGWLPSRGPFAEG
ncbi:MAG: hypothetical protein ACRDLB_01950 [Actinomycetota bacterium]